ncbi:MAG: ADP-glyceromanno-heptose 6-epimerase [Thermoanaerobaculales bacterium]
MKLVTGGAGFIGSNIVASVCDRGEPVVICDRLRSQEKWRNIAKRDLVDIVAPEKLETWLSVNGTALDAIIHMGAISSTTERDADLITEVNFRLSLFLWRWCAEHGVPLVYASSAATYGNGSEGFDDDPSRDALARLKPLNAYGWSKHLFDRRVQRALDEGEPAPPQWVGLKFFNVYGPNENHKGGMKSVVAQKLPLAVADQPVTLFKSCNSDFPDGGQRRDFIFVEDCVDVVLWLLDNPRVSGLFNLGTGTDRSFEAFANAIFAALDTTPQITFIDMPESIREKYQYFTRAQMDRLRVAGYEQPFTSIEDGVRTYVQEYLLAPDPYR